MNRARCGPHPEAALGPRDRGDAAGVPPLHPARLRFTEQRLEDIPGSVRIGKQLAVVFLVQRDAEFIEEGHFTGHIKRMRGVYSERRAVLLDEMKACLGDLVSPSDGHAGLQIVYRFNQPLDDTMVVAQSLAEGVVCRPLSMYYIDQSRRQPGLNLGFAAVPEGRIRPAVHTLASVIEREHARMLQRAAQKG